METVPAQVLHTAEEEAVEASLAAGSTRGQDGVGGNVSDVHADEQRMGRRGVLEQAPRVVGNLRRIMRLINPKFIRHSSRCFTAFISTFGTNIKRLKFYINISWICLFYT